MKNDDLICETEKSFVVSSSHLPFFILELRPECQILFSIYPTPLHSSSQLLCYSIYNCDTIVGLS